MIVTRNYYNSFKWIGTLSRDVKIEYKERHYDELPICPKCSDFRACPFVNMTKYCQEVKIKNLIDNPLGIYILIFVVLWCKYQVKYSVGYTNK